MRARTRAPHTHMFVHTHELSIQKVQWRLISELLKVRSETEGKSAVECLMSVCAGVRARARSSHMHTPTDASHVHVDSEDTEEAAETVLIVHIAEGNAGAVQGTAAVESKGRVRMHMEGGGTVPSAAVYVPSAAVQVASAAVQVPSAAVQVPSAAVQVPLAAVYVP